MVATTPRVSVLLPVYDGADTLELSLRSIARQTEPRFECVILDDGSTDRSLTIARDQAQRDDRFRVMARPHQGLVATLNAGIEACRAPVVARMDADDLMHRDRLAAQLAALDSFPELSAVGCHVRLFPRADLTDGLRAYERWLNHIDSPQRLERDAFVECPIAHPTLCIRQAVLAKLGYRDQGWPEDYDLVLRLLASGHRLGVVPRRYLFWRDGPSRLSRTDEAYSDGAFTACRAHFLAQGMLANRDDYVLWGFGGTGKALRKALADHGKHPVAIVELHPGRIGQRIHGAPVIRPEGLSELPNIPVLASVAGQPAREEIRAALAGMGRTELDDFVCCA
ncbi:MAG: glycosyltransferase family 2 protein [Deltaproteobacteria bacterium]|nr:glycosyltransferase family 2 protein [Deltaproteobacteria bacterium]